MLTPDDWCLFKVTSHVIFLSSLTLDPRWPPDKVTLLHLAGCSSFSVPLPCSSRVESSLTLSCCHVDTDWMSLSLLPRPMTSVWTLLCCWLTNQGLPLVITQQSSLILSFHPASHYPASIPVNYIFASLVALWYNHYCDAWEQLCAVRLCLLVSSFVHGAFLLAICTTAAFNQRIQLQHVYLDDLKV